MSQNHITLHQNLSAEFDHRDVVNQVEFRDSDLFDLKKLLKEVTDVFIGYVSILCHVC